MAVGRFYGLFVACNYRLRKSIVRSFSSWFFFPDKEQPENKRKSSIGL
jgi:hypothetical protein